MHKVNAYYSKNPYKYISFLFFKGVSALLSLFYSLATPNKTYFKVYLCGDIPF
jgi:hypothetical protein